MHIFKAPCICMNHLQTALKLINKERSNDCVKKPIEQNVCIQEDGIRFFAIAVQFCEWTIG